VSGLRGDGPVVEAEIRVSGSPVLVFILTP